MAHFRLLADVYVPSYRLNYFTVRQQDKAIRVGYCVIPKKVPDAPTFLEKLVILGRHETDGEEISAETFLP